MMVSKTKYLCQYKGNHIYAKYLKALPYTVEPYYPEHAYFELLLIAKWKSGPCFTMKLWQQVTK